jgi:hypothetical protein
MKKRFETEANEIQHLNKAASISGENAEWNERRAEFYCRVWVWTGRLAHLAFIIGMTLLLLFAITNT